MSAEEFVCPVCDKTFTAASSLNRHMGSKHKDEAPPSFEPPADVEPPPSLNLADDDVKPKRKPRAYRGSLAPQIRDAVLMTSAVVAIRDPRIYVAVEATVDEFAVAWDNVAKQSPQARKYIQAMLSGGVWISAVGATLVMVVTTLAVTEALPPNLEPLGAFALNKANIRLVPHTPVPEPFTPNGAADDTDPILH